MIFQDTLDWVAFGWFLALWVGYTAYAVIASKKKDSLANLLFKYRLDWIKAMLHRENRIADMALLNGMTQLASFLASTTLFVVAGTLTALSSADKVMALLAGHSFIAETNEEQVQFKILLLVLIFVFAFFRLTWSLRQYTFCAIMLGAAPYVKHSDLTKDEMEFASAAAKVCDRAAREFNYGLRAYYFGLALISWFISPWFFMLSCTLVVAVLYRREFRSMTLRYLVQGRKGFGKAQQAGKLSSV